MFLKLTDARNGKKVLINMDFCAMVVRAASGGSLVTWRDADLISFEVKEALELIENLLTGERG